MTSEGKTATTVYWLPDDNKITFSHSINLIMAMPAKLYDNLIPPIGNMEDKPQFEGKNMEVLVVMSDFLYRRLVISRAVSFSTG
jgi:hypothetical protein